jgi:uracil-DNA glycosylase
MRACYFCREHLPFEPNPVFQLSIEARILIVGQAPGLRAHLTNLPFNDPSGIRLRQWLGVTPQQFYNSLNFALVPMGLCYPGTDPRGGDRPPCRKCAPLWHPQVITYLKNIELILLVGHYAHAYYLQLPKKSSLTETVASWKKYLPKFLPIPHPSWRNTGWLKKNPWFEKEILPFLQERVKTLLFKSF